MLWPVGLPNLNIFENGQYRKQFGNLYIILLYDDIPRGEIIRKHIYFKSLLKRMV